MKDTPRSIDDHPAEGATRRDVLKWGAGAGGLMLAGSPLAAMAQAGGGKMESELVFGCNGGLTQKMFEQHFIPVFSKKYGAKVTYVAGQPANNLAKVRAQKNNPSMDVIWLAGGVTYQAIGEELVQPLDWSRIPSKKLLPASLLTQERAVPVGVTTLGLLYNTKVFKDKGLPPPTSWWDMWDPKFKGHVGSYSINVSAANALVVKVSQMLTGDYKNLDAAFAKFKQLMPNMLGFYPSAGAWETAFQQGDMWLGMNTSVRAQQMADAGLPVGFAQPKEGLVGYETWAGIVAGAPHPNLAHAWVDYLISTEFQQKMPETIGYNPVNPNVKIAANLEQYFPSIEKIFIPDWKYLSGQMKTIVERWNREVER